VAAPPEGPPVGAHSYGLREKPRKVLNHLGIQVLILSSVWGWEWVCVIGKQARDAGLRETGS
jgi:hypothetical protein